MSKQSNQIYRKEKDKKLGLKADNSNASESNSNQRSKSNYVDGNLDSINSAKKIKQIKSKHALYFVDKFEKYRALLLSYDFLVKIKMTRYNDMKTFYILIYI